MEINWEAVGDVFVKQIIGTEDFRKFCDEKCCEFENVMRDEIETKFVDPIRSKYFKFNDDDEGAGAEFEFVMNVTHSLLHAFTKYFATDYLGYKK